MDSCDVMEMIDKLNKEHDITFQENAELRKEIQLCRDEVISIKKENKKIRILQNKLHSKNVNLDTEIIGWQHSYKKEFDLVEELFDVIKGLDREDLLNIGKSGELLRTD